MKTKTTPQTASLADRIFQKNEALDRLEVIKNTGIPAALDEAKQLDREIFAINDQLAGMDQETYPARIAELNEKRALLTSRQGAANQRLADLQAELNRLEYEVLPGLMQDTSLAEVLDHQSRIQALRDEAKQLEDAIQGQWQVIGDAEAAIVVVPDRNGDRAAILADIAIGAAGQGKLDEIDALIAGERAAHETSRAQAEPVISQARQTIAGLEGKLIALRTKIADMEQDTPGVLEQYLMSEITSVSLRYVGNAQAVKEDFLRLAALEKILHRVCGKDAPSHLLRPIIQHEIILPLPQIKQCEALRDKVQPWLLFGIAPGFSQPSLDSHYKHELERLRGEGIRLPG